MSFCLCLSITQLLLQQMEQDQQQVYFDAHNHLLDYGPQAQTIINEAISNNVKFCAPNSTRQADYSPLLQLFNRYPITLQQTHQKQFSIIPSFGIHPYYLQYEKQNKIWKQNLIQLLQKNQMFMVGEIGIDYRKQVLQINDKPTQNQFFITQLEISFLMNRTVTIHCVRAHGEMLKFLKKYNKLFQAKDKGNFSQQEISLRSQYRNNPIIMHSYGGSKEITQSLLKLNNLNIFFSLCLKRTAELCEVIPIDKLILETDAPYQNNLLLLKQQGLYNGQISEQICKENDKQNRLQYMKANISSLCGYYQMDRYSFSKVVLQNTLRAFRLIKH